MSLWDLPFDGLLARLQASRDSELSPNAITALGRAYFEEACDAKISAFLSLV